MIRLLAVFIVLYSAGFCFGDTQTFTHGETTLEVEFVTVSSPGNLPDVNGSGGVDYVYAISKYELQHQEPCFVGREINVLFGRSCDEDTAGLNLTGSVASLGHAAAFVNWMNTSKGYPAAYKSPMPHDDALSAWSVDDEGYDAEHPFRNGGAVFVLPTTDEWYKAAYYDPDEERYWGYATGSDEVPVDVEAGTAAGTARLTSLHSEYAPFDQAGGLSAYGTMGQTGNRAEWEETHIQTDAGQETAALRFGSEIGSPLATQHRRLASRRSSQSYTFPGTIRVVYLPFLEGDFNRDRQVDAADIDALSEQIRSMGTDELYDVNGDGLVDMDDHTFWVEDLKGILHGDANMNGVVEFEDFLALSGAFETDGGWAGGDFDGSGLTDFDDFLTLSGNFGQTVTAVASVPEPASFVLLSLSLLGMGAMRIRH